MTPLRRDDGATSGCFPSPSAQRRPPRWSLPARHPRPMHASLRWPSSRALMSSPLMLAPRVQLLASSRGARVRHRVIVLLEASLIGVSPVVSIRRRATRSTSFLRWCRASALCPSSAARSLTCHSLHSTARRASAPRVRVERLRCASQDGAACCGRTLAA